MLALICQHLQIARVEGYLYLQFFVIHFNLQLRVCRILNVPTFNINFYWFSYHLSLMAKCDRPRQRQKALRDPPILKRLDPISLSRNLSRNTSEHLSLGESSSCRRSPMGIASLPVLTSPVGVASLPILSSPTVVRQVSYHPQVSPEPSDEEISVLSRIWNANRSDRQATASALVENHYKRSF